MRAPFCLSVGRSCFLLVSAKEISCSVTIMPFCLDGPRPRYTQVQAGSPAELNIFSRSGNVSPNLDTLDEVCNSCWAENSFIVLERLVDTIVLADLNVCSKSCSNLSATLRLVRLSISPSHTILPVRPESAAAAWAYHTQTSAASYTCF